MAIEYALASCSRWYSYQQRIECLGVMRWRISFLILVFYGLTLGGCASSLVVETNVDVPTPLMKAVPLNVAVYYPQEMREHSYQENSNDRPNWSILTGPSQVALFDQILQSMFTSVTLIENEKTEDVGYDVLIVPAIKDMQFALPNETGMELYEVWIDYAISFRQAGGKQVKTINVSGYGASPETFFSRDSNGLLQASNVAFRELGAQIIINLLQNPDIQKLLQPMTVASERGPHGF